MPLVAGVRQWQHFRDAVALIFTKPAKKCCMRWCNGPKACDNGSSDFVSVRLPLKFWSIITQNSCLLTPTTKAELNQHVFAQVCSWHYVSLQQLMGVGFIRRELGYMVQHLLCAFTFMLATSQNFSFNWAGTSGRTSVWKCNLGSFKDIRMKFLPLVILGDVIIYIKFY